MYCASANRQLLRARHTGHRRAAGVMIYSVFIMTAMLLFGSLAVDWGRVQLAKTEMQTAVDAAGRAAVAYLPSDTAGARSAAIALAAQHTVDGKPLVLQSGDVVFGKWNAATNTLDTSSSAPDAVRITAHRTTARGSPISLTMTQPVGLNSIDLRFTAIVRGEGNTAQYGIVGLDSFNMSSGALTGTYDSSANSWTVGASSAGGSIAGNSWYNLGSDVSIGGVVFYNTASAPSGTYYAQAKTKLTTAVPVPATPSAGSYTSSNSNSSIGLPTNGANANVSSGGTVNYPAGNYVLNSWNVSGTTIQFTGPATVWMYGNVGLNSSQILAYQNKPTNLQIKFCSASGFNLNGSTVYAVVTAPTTPANINSGSKMVGSIVVKDMSVVGSSIYYDQQLGANGTSGGGGSSLVQ